MKFIETAFWFLCAGLVMTGALQLLARRRRRGGTIVNIRTGEIQRAGGFSIDDQRSEIMQGERSKA